MSWDLEVCQLCPSCLVKLRIMSAIREHNADGNAKSNTTFSTTCSSESTFAPELPSDTGETRSLYKADDRAPSLIKASRSRRQLSSQRFLQPPS